MTPLLRPDEQRKSTTTTPRVDNCNALGSCRGEAVQGGHWKIERRDESPCLARAETLISPPQPSAAQIKNGRGEKGATTLPGLPPSG